MKRKGLQVISKVFQFIVLAALMFTVAVFSLQAFAEALPLPV